MKLRREITLLICLTGTILFFPRVFAQNAPSPIAGEIGEIVVTAQRRSERLQDVPVSVQAFNATQLEASGVANTTDLPLLTPGLVIPQQAGWVQPFLRGVGTIAVGPENPVALYIDGVYFGTQGGSAMSLVDVEQVEVDKGPQGTLFGRNATGGLIQVTTKDPSQSVAGSATITYGNYNTAGTDFYLNGGVSGNLATNLAVHYQNQEDGFGTNLYSGKPIGKSQDLDVRNKWQLATANDTIVKLILDYEQTHYIPNYGSAPGTLALGAPGYPVPWQDIAGIFEPFGAIHQGGASVQIQHDFSFGRFTDITAYRRTEMFVMPQASLAVDPAYALNLLAWSTRNQYSQEFQLQSLPGRRITWATGVYLYYADDGSTPPSLIYGGLIAPVTYVTIYGHSRSTSAATYGQATTEVLPATNLTIGIRYTAERRDYRGNEVVGLPDGSSITEADAQHKLFEKPTWRLSLDHHFTPDVMAYASYNRGFKSGGFNGSLFPTIAYQPEVLDAYEIGTKMTSLNRRLNFNMAGFFYNYKQIQVVEYIATTGTSFIYNGAAARIYGLDFDARLKISDNLSVTAAAEYLHNYFTSFPDAAISTPVPGGGTSYTAGSAAGNALPYSPKSTVSLTADYVVPLGTPGTVTLTATYSYNDGWYGEPDNRLRQPAYDLLNAQVSWSSPSDIYKVQLWGKNLSNTDYSLILGSQVNGDFNVFGQPRTYGITASRKF